MNDDFWHINFRIISPRAVDCGGGRLKIAQWQLNKQRPSIPIRTTTSRVSWKINNVEGSVSQHSSRLTLNKSHRSWTAIRAMQHQCDRARNGGEILEYENIYFGDTLSLFRVTWCCWVVTGEPLPSSGTVRFRVSQIHRHLWPTSWFRQKLIAARWLKRIQMNDTNFSLRILNTETVKYTRKESEFDTNHKENRDKWIREIGPKWDGMVWNRNWAF